MKTQINADLVKARIDELQVDVDSIKSELTNLKESSRGKVNVETIQQIEEFTRKLLIFKSGQAELINLLQ